MENHHSGSGSTGELGRLLAHLKGKLAELDQLQTDLAQDTQALALAVTSATEDPRGTRSVYSIREAAHELGVSTSMLHKLLKDRRLGHLKVGARTLITREHLERFRAASEVIEPLTVRWHADTARAIERLAADHARVGPGDPGQSDGGQSDAAQAGAR